MRTRDLAATASCFHAFMAIMCTDVARPPAACVRAAVADTHAAAAAARTLTCNTQSARKRHRVRTMFTRNIERMSSIAQ